MKNTILKVINVIFFFFVIGILIYVYSTTEEMPSHQKTGYIFAIVVNTIVLLLYLKRWENIKENVFIKDEFDGVSFLKSNTILFKNLFTLIFISIFSFLISYSISDMQRFDFFNSLNFSRLDNFLIDHFINNILYLFVLPFFSIINLIMFRKTQIDKEMASVGYLYFSYALLFLGILYAFVAFYALVFVAVDGLMH